MISRNAIRSQLSAIQVLRTGLRCKHRGFESHNSTTDIEARTRISAVHSVATTMEFTMSKALPFQLHDPNNNNKSFEQFNPLHNIPEALPSYQKIVVSRRLHQLEAQDGRSSTRDSIRSAGRAHHALSVELQVQDSSKNRRDQHRQYSKHYDCTQGDRHAQLVSMVSTDVAAGIDLVLVASTDTIVSRSVASKGMIRI